MRDANVLCPLYWLILWNDNYLKFRASPLLWLRKYGVYSAFWGLRRSGKLSKFYMYITILELWKVGRFKRWRKSEQITPNADNIYLFSMVLYKQILCYKGNKVCCLYCVSSTPVFTYYIPAVI